MGVIELATDQVEIAEALGAKGRVLVGKRVVIPSPVAIKPGVFTDDGARESSHRAQGATMRAKNGVEQTGVVAT